MPAHELIYQEDYDDEKGQESVALARKLAEEEKRRIERERDCDRE